MKCVEVEKQFDSLIDSEISSFYKKQIEIHLENCHSCGEKLKRIQTISGLVKNSLSDTAPNQLDLRVMEAFNQHHNKNLKQTKSIGVWTTLLGSFSIPKPILAFSLLTFVVITGLAFQLGRISSTNQIQPNSIAENRNQDEAKPEIKETIQTKIVEVPITKYVKVPIIQEKIVYRDRNKQVNKLVVNKPLEKESPTNNEKIFNRISLKDYQPLSEIKMKVIKKGESYNE